MSRWRYRFALASVVLVGGGTFVTASCTCIIPGFPQTPAGCTVADASGCTSNMAGTDLEITVNSANAQSANFFANCNAAITTWAAAYNKGTQGVDYTRTGTGWPVKVALNFTVGTTDGPHNGFNFANGCTGDGDPTTIDMFLCVEGNGRDTGFGQDAVKVGGTSHDVQVVSRPSVCTNIQSRDGGINCGPKASSSVHQDPIQFQGATNIQWFDSYIGDWSNFLGTCAGSGGAPFINAVAPTSYCLGSPGCEWIRGRSIACNHGTNVKIATQSGVTNPGNSHGVIANSITRNGAAQDIADGLCSGASNSNNFATEAPGWTFTANIADRYCPTACTWSPPPFGTGNGFNPADN